jgi:tetratricopeptide (TPR) repeat protein
MSDQAKDNDLQMVPAARDLARVAAPNPLVGRGLADLARNNAAAKPSVSCEKAFLCFLSGDLDEAIRLFDEAIQSNPSHSFAYYLRGGAWLRKSRRASDNKACDKAIHDFGEAIRIDPEYTSAYEQRGVAWCCKKDYDGAIRDFGEAIRIDPECTSAYEQRGVAWCCKKDYDAAIRDFDEAIRLLSIAEAEHLQETDKDLEPLRRSKAEVYYCRGNAWVGKSDYERAFADYDGAVRLDPESTLAYLARGKAALAMDQAGLDNIDLKKMFNDFDEAIRLEPTNAWAYIERGVAWFVAARRPDQALGNAIRDFDRAIRIDPNNPVACQNRAKAVKKLDEVIRRGKERLEKFRALNAPESILENELRRLSRVEAVQRLVGTKADQ